MEKFINISEIDQAAKYISSKTTIKLKAAIILGSGLGGVADEVETPEIIGYEEIPGWPQTTVIGHKSRLVIGKLAGTPVMVMQGRTHYYEGYG
ncbi:MAG: purine-nucleoside phosphorylase, partial [Bacteroidales bacterium]|nr:purine-nucleoside phosphorylase [Bacteroidales bacterium]